MSNYLCSYHPLRMTRTGRQAVSDYGMLPYVDGSCRREPDFENQHPSITAICRGRLFAPRLSPNDRIIYITCKDKHGLNYRHWRLVGALEVLQRSTHQGAYDWYMENGLQVPSNCMAIKDGFLPMHLTSGNKLTIRQWNHHYLVRARNHDVFLRCRHVTDPRLIEPPILTEEDFYRLIGGDPFTRVPQPITDDQFDAFVGLIGR